MSFCEYLVEKINPAGYSLLAYLLHATETPNVSVLRKTLCQHLLINCFVTIRHSLHTEVVEHMLPTSVAIQLVSFCDRLYTLFNVVTQKACLPVGNHLWRRT